ncbi:major centromere autoantigen B-like [Pistacia vera]|uniref:major centromere autoantigen B-like n=1 Tax=Pistacia vera TaxID=55513 RepID=UPI001263E03B|nr:major centromere autoantigen B-like [Pistacia vera]
MAAPVDHLISEGGPQVEETSAAQEQREESANGFEDEESGENSGQEEESGENSGKEESFEDLGDDEEAGEERIVRTINCRDYELEPISEKKEEKNSTPLQIVDFGGSSSSKVVEEDAPMDHPMREGGPEAEKMTTTQEQREESKNCSEKENVGEEMFISIVQIFRSVNYKDDGLEVVSDKVSFEKMEEWMKRVEEKVDRVAEKVGRVEEEVDGDIESG